MGASQEYAKALYDLSLDKETKETILYNFSSLIPPVCSSDASDYQTVC